MTGDMLPCSGYQTSTLPSGSVGEDEPIASCKQLSQSHGLPGLGAPLVVDMVNHQYIVCTNKDMPSDQYWEEMLQAKQNSM